MKPLAAGARELRAFGCAVLRGCLPAADVEALRAAFDRTMADAPRFDQFGDAGSRMRSHAEDVDPVFARLIGRPDVLAALGELLGAPALFLGSFLLHNCDDTPWHTTGMPGEGPETLRVSIYLDASDADEGGALQVIAGSHLREYNQLLFEQFGRFEGPGTRLELPARAAPGALEIATRPGDVVVWYTRLWHAAYRRHDGGARRGIFLTYVQDPAGDRRLCEKLRRTAAGIVRPQRQYLYGPSLVEHGGDGIRAMARRLTELGVRDVLPDAFTSDASECRAAS